MSDPYISPYVELDAWPSGSWRSAALWRDADGDDQNILRYKAFGDQLSGREALPRWAGDTRPVAAVPDGLDPDKAPMAQAWETDRPPDGKWVLGVVTQTPGTMPPRTFMVCGPAREDDPAAAVQHLHEGIASSRSQAGGPPATHHAPGTDRRNTLDL